MSHDVEHHVVGGTHGIGTDGREVVDAAVYIVVDDALGRSDATALHGEQRGEQSCADSRRDLERTTGLGSVADHARKVSHHILHRVADALIVAAHEIGDAATAAYGRHHTAAQRRQLAEALLDVDGGEMAEHEGSDEFFLGVLVFDGIDGNGIGSADALVAAAAVAHHGYHGSSHTGVACRCGARDDVREDAVAEDAVTHGAVHGLA